MSEYIDPRAGANMAETAARRPGPATSVEPTTGPEQHFASAESEAEAHAAISVLSDRRFLNVRLGPRDGRAVEATERVLGQPVPLIPNTYTTGEHRVYWLGPDEWLIETAAEHAAGLGGELAEALAEFHAAINDLSGGYVALGVSGTDARTVLAKGCTLDPHPREFAPGQCARTGLAKATVLLAAVDDAPTYTLIVARSFSDYLCRWFARIL